MTLSPTSTVECIERSIEAGDPATRGGRTTELGSIAMPSRAASSTEGSTSALVPLHSTSWSVLTTLMTNSSVARTLASVSLRPTEVKVTTGGVAAATEKNECGARLPTPSALSVETHAIGRGR